MDSLQITHTSQACGNTVRFKMAPGRLTSGEVPIPKSFHQVACKYQHRNSDQSGDVQGHWVETEVKKDDMM